MLRGGRFCSSACERGDVGQAGGCSLLPMATLASPASSPPSILAQRELVGTLAEATLGSLWPGSPRHPELLCDICQKRISPSQSHGPSLSFGRHRWQVPHLTREDDDRMITG